MKVFTNALLTLTLLFASVATAWAQIDIEVVKTVDNGIPLVMSEVVYTISATNLGVGLAEDIEITDVLPPGILFVSSSDGSYDPDDDDFIWNINELAAGATATLDIRVQVRATSHIENCAELTNPVDVGDTDDSNDRSCTTVTARDQITFWLNMNREAGTVPSMAFSPNVGKSSASGTIFAGADGGLFYTVDGGDNWAPTALTGVNVRGVAVSTANDALWVATYGDGAFRSDDLGSSFDPFDPGSDNLLALAINNYNPVSGGDGDVFFGSDGSGVLYSGNDGTTWVDISGAGLTGLPSGNGRIIRTIFIEEDGVAANEDRVWVGTHGRGLYYLDYSDIGVPVWTAANGLAGTLSLTVVHAIAMEGSDIFVGTGSGVYKSGDGGDNWDLVLPDVVVKALLVYTDGVDTYIIAGTDGDYVFRSDDTGILGDSGTWTQFDGLGGPNDGISGFQSKTILSFLFIDGVLYAGTTDFGVHRSLDFGEKWEQISAVALNAVIQSLVFTDNGDVLFAGTAGYGVLRSSDITAQVVNWARANGGLTNQHIYSMAVKDVSGTDLVFAGTWGNGIFRSSDHGANWHFVGLGNQQVYDIQVHQDGMLFASSDRGAVSRSDDNGLTWRQIGTATTALWSLALDGPDDIYAGTFGAGVMKSTDQGFTWSQTGMTSGHVFDFEFDGGFIYAATSTGVQRSDDGGVTWTDFSVGLSVRDVRAIAKADTRLLAATWGDGVFFYDVATSSWIRDGLPRMQVVALSIHPASGDVFVGTNGGGVFRKQFASSTGTEAGYEEVPAEFALSQNYPNPFNPLTTIQFTIPETANIRLAVYDMLGRRVALLLDGPQAAGNHEVAFDASQLPSGVYFYQIESAQRTMSRKMILMK